MNQRRITKPASKDPLDVESYAAATWLQITVVLTAGYGEAIKHAPGRIFAVAPTHTFHELAQAIDTAFGRYHQHLHEFTVPGYPTIGQPELDEETDELILDDRDIRVGQVLQPDDLFEYFFDFGDDWRHRCTVAHALIDPATTLGIIPDQPLPFSSWGVLPDQSGMRTAGEAGEALAP